MKWILLCLIQFSILVSAQILRPANGRNISDEERRFNDSIEASNKKVGPADSLKIYNPKISDYNYWTTALSKRKIDTVLSIDSYYKQNVYQKDLFAYQQFPNLGQPLQALEPEFIEDNLQLLPKGKSDMYIFPEEVKYYDVKTPLTEFIFENGVNEGQYLSTTFTHNIHSRWNYAITYNSLKSQGNYLNSLVNNSNIVVSSNYRTKNDRYIIKGNFVTHDLNAQENGGLTEESINYFITDDANFSNRERMYINLSSAQSKYDERRVHLDHQFGIFNFGKKTDSIQVPDSLQTYNYPIYIKHSIDYKHQAFQYQEGSVEDYYTSDVLEGDRNNRKKFDLLENRIGLGYQWSDKLDVEGGFLHQIMELYYDENQTIDELTIAASAKDNRIGAYGTFDFDWKSNIHLSANATYTKGDKFGDSYKLNVRTRLIPFSNFFLEGGLKLQSSLPSINFYNNQSFYTDFNYNNQGFENQNIQELYALLTYKQLGLTAFGSIINVNNYVYLDSDYLPKQVNGMLNYFKLGAREHYKFNKFGIDVQAQFQKVVNNQDKLPLPDVVARASIYYDTWAFKNHANIQTGISTTYYNKFNAREFFPVINEFNLSDENRQIGNYPKTDLFFNIKVDRMRIYLRGENINSFFQRGEYFSTPLQPAKDFKIQVGIHWFLLS